MDRIEKELQYNKGKDKVYISGYSNGTAGYTALEIVVLLAALAYVVGYLTVLF